MLGGSGSNTERKLLELTSHLELETNQSNSIETEVILDSELDIIDDLVSKNFDRILTNKDYLILVALDNKGIESVASEYNVSISYIKKLMRSIVGSEFLKLQAKQKSETALAIASISVAEGMLKYSQLVNNLFEKGQTELALSYLFGKQSLSEVQNMLHKQQAELPNEDTNELKSLYTDLLSSNIRG